MTHFLAVIPVQELKPVSPTDVGEQEFIAGSPQDQPKRAELDGLKRFGASGEIFTLRA